MGINFTDLNNITGLENLNNMTFWSQMLTELNIPVVSNITLAFTQLNITTFDQLIRLTDMKFLAEMMTNLSVPILPDLLRSFG